MEENQFKSQPWKVHDAIVANSFLLGDTTQGNLAVGTQGPAISAGGEMIFFASGRLQPNLPWYTSLQQVGALSYGFEVWQMSITLMLPPMQATNNGAVPYEVQAGAVFTSPVMMLAHSLVFFGVMSMDLGQEDQMSWPVQCFGSGGGLHATNTFDGNAVQNGTPEESNQLKLPEPIMIPRTQALSAKIRLAAEVHALIGTVAAPGVGSPLGPYPLELGEGSVELESPPFGIRFVLTGRRIKKTQYGQLPDVAA